jgi:hypothetical protein
MKHSRAIFVPMFLVAAVSLFFLLYSLFGLPHQGSLHPGPGRSAPGMGMRADRGMEGWFRTLGTAAVFPAAFSYAWLNLRKKRKSGSLFVRMLVNWFDKLHRLAGYAAVLLVAAHGIYYLTQAAFKRETYTGIAAFALLLGAAIYGFLIRRLPNRYMRKIHFLGMTGFAAAALVHAGGSAVAATAGVISLWILVGLIDSRTSHPSTEGTGSSVSK